MVEERLAKQIEFIVEIDKVKDVFRQTLLINCSRKENDAEHSWHLAIMACLLGEYAPKNTDITKVMKMVLIHDLVEIDAGDTYCYDEQGNLDKAQREQKAAERIFNILPENQGTELRKLWDEFEERTTAEARFAAALDVLQPLIHNYRTGGKSWQEHQVTSQQVRKRKSKIGDDLPALRDFAEELIKDAVLKGYLQE